MFRKKGAVLKSLGLCLVFLAVLLAAFNLRDSAQAAARAAETLDILEEVLPEAPAGPQDTLSAPAVSQEEEIPDYLLNPDMPLPETVIDGRAYIGTLEIPALELTLPVISQWSDAALKNAPCRYGGSPYSGGFIIAGHNYRGHFGRLRALPEGSAVTFTDMDGNRFSYEVVLTETLRADEVEEMCSGDWALTLFTCTGGNRYRLAVRCREVL